MRMQSQFRRLVVCLIVAGCTGLLAAQGPPGRDHDNPPPGHGGMPPGQAKKAERGMPPGQERKTERGLPPGQAKKYFREEDRDHFYGYYRHDVDRRDRRRPVFIPGQYIARTYVVQAVPPQYWQGAVPPPPPGYRYGYVSGYVVAYNPTTRIIADVLDLVAAARGR